MVLKLKDPSVEPTEEYEQFIKDLEAYHEKRGTVLDAKPKVGPRHIDLMKLYKRVVEEGGYDHVSDTKGNKLAWRRIAQDFMPHNVNVVQMAFLLKTAYYKNLACVILFVSVFVYDNYTNALFVQRIRNSGNVQLRSSGSLS